MVESTASRRVVASVAIEVMGGHLVVAKRRPGGGSHAGRLHAEARWLVAARHPGVVAVHRVGTEVLATHFAGSATLATTPLRGAVRALVVARVADTVAELHTRGLVHGALTPDHIVLAGPSQSDPVLCSPAQPTDHDGATTSRTGEPRGDDVAALAALASGGRRSRLRAASFGADAALEAVASWIRRPGPPPSAGAVADRLAEVVHRLRRWDRATPGR